MRYLIFFAALVISSNALCKGVEKTLNIGGGSLQIHLPTGVKASEKAQIRWIEKAAQAVSQYFGRYPVKAVTIEVANQGPGSRIGGTTWSGRKIQLRLGEDVSDQDLDDDWTATHEMFHLAFPQMDDQFNWMSEGLATYLEPLARVRKG